MGIKSKRYKVGDLVTRANDPQQHIFDKLIHTPPAQDIWDMPDGPPRSYGIVLSIKSKQHGSRRQIITVYWHRWPSPYCSSHVRQNVASELKLLSRT